MSENRDRQYFQSLAKQLMFQLSDEEAGSLSDDFKILDKQLAKWFILWMWKRPS